jgi:hypothetical protein
MSRARKHDANRRPPERATKRKTHVARRHGKAHGIAALLHFSCRNGHTIPAVQTLEKIARALEVPMYRLFFAGKPEVLKLAKSQNNWGSGKDAEEFGQFRRAIRKIKKESDLHPTCVHGAKDVLEVRTYRQKIEVLKLSSWPGCGPLTSMPPKS